MAFFSLSGSNCGSKPSPDFTLIDRYLTTWDPEYESYPLYEEWLRREFTQNVAIKMYQSAAKNPK